MQQMMIQAQKMQRELNKALAELAKQEFSVNKSGAVTITMMGDGSLKVKSNWLTPFDTLSMPILYITGNHEMMHGKNLERLVLI